LSDFAAAVIDVLRMMARKTSSWRAFIAEGNNPRLGPPQEKRLDRHIEACDDQIHECSTRFKRAPQAPG
jgi:hypothetical protein